MHSLVSGIPHSGTLIIIIDLKRFGNAIFEALTEYLCDSGRLMRPNETHLIKCEVYRFAPWISKQIFK